MADPPAITRRTRDDHRPAYATLATAWWPTPKENRIHNHPADPHFDAGDPTDPLTPADHDALDGHAAQDAQFDAELPARCTESAREIVERAIARNPDMTCSECAEPIVFLTAAHMPHAGWFHVDVPDEPHEARPACTCYRPADVPDPRCRIHGHEDVVSGAYDVNPKLAARIDRTIAGMGDVN